VAYCPRITKVKIKNKTIKVEELKYLKRATITKNTINEILAIA
jgi:hypothetical protein